jgi:hypothetical protein
VTDEPLYATLGFTDAEWGLLVGLPQAVLTAASAATPDSARKTRTEADAETYKHWLVDIADTVVGAASTGGVLGIGGETVTETERAFRDQLAKVLSD